MGIQQHEEELVKEFSGITDWETRYKKIIELGKSLKAYPEAKRTEDYKVKGCQSQVWLFAEKLEDGNIRFLADSDALIVKGLVALLLKLYSNTKPEEIINYEPQFFKEIDLSSHLSPSRANGLAAMMKQIKFYAIAFSTLNPQY